MHAENAQTGLPPSGRRCAHVRSLQPPEEGRVTTLSRSLPTMLNSCMHTVGPVNIAPVGHNSWVLQAYNLGT